MGNAILVRRSGVDVSDGTALQNQVLADSSFYAGENSDIQTGTMPNRGAVNQALNAGGVYTIPEGYHNGMGKVSAASLEGQTQGTATPTQILSGQTAYVNGQKITGTMPNRGANNIVLPVNGNVVIPEGYHNGQGRVTQSIITRSASTAAVSVAGTNPMTVRIPQGYYGTNTSSGYPEISVPLASARSAGFALQSELTAMTNDRNNWMNVANSRINYRFISKEAYNKASGFLGSFTLDFKKMIYIEVRYGNTDEFPGVTMINNRQNIGIVVPYINSTAFRFYSVVNSSGTTICGMSENTTYCYIPYDTPYTLVFRNYWLSCRVTFSVSTGGITISNISNAEFRDYKDDKIYINAHLF